MRKRKLRKKKKIGKAQKLIAQLFSKNLIKRKRKLRKNWKSAKRKLSNIFKSIITKAYCFENQCRRYGGSGGGQGRRQKNFRGRQQKKDRKISKTTENSTIKPLPEGRGGATEKKTEK